MKERGDRLLSHPYGSGSGSWSPEHKTLPVLSPTLWIWGYRGEIVFVAVASLEQDNAPAGGYFLQFAPLLGFPGPGHTLELVAGESRPTAVRG